jgi:hypothetical protein
VCAAPGRPWSAAARGAVSRSRRPPWPRSRTPTVLPAQARRHWATAACTGRRTCWNTPLPHRHRDWGSPVPHLHRDWGSPPATSAPGLGLAACHICTGTGARPLPHLHRDWWGSPPAASAPGLGLAPCRICTGTGGLAPWHICTHWRDLTVVQAAAVEQLVGAFGGGAARRAELSAVDVGSGGSPRYRRVPFRVPITLLRVLGMLSMMLLRGEEPSRAEPSRAEPSRAEPSRAEPSRVRQMPAAADANDCVCATCACFCVCRRAGGEEGPQVRTRQSFR